MTDRTSRYEDLQQPQKRGRATEAIIRSAFAVRDIPVLIPASDDEPYDLVVEVGGRFHRIRCETAYRKSKGTVAVETVRTQRGHERDDRAGDNGCAEYVAVYDPVNDDRYLIPVSDAATGKMELRFREPKNGQRVGINWADDYRFDERLEDLRDSP